MTDGSFQEGSRMDGAAGMNGEVGMDEVGMSGVQAVIFDWGGTLTPWHTIDLVEQWRVYAEHYASHHADEHPDGGKDLAARMAVAEQEAWARLKRDGASARL